MSRTSDAWSFELQKQTQRAVEEVDFDFQGDFVAFKNVDGRFGLISVGDLLGGRLVLTDRRSGDTKTFADAQQLIHAGWAID